MIVSGTPDGSMMISDVVPKVPVPGAFLASIAVAIATGSPPWTTIEIEWPGMPRPFVVSVSFS